MKLVFNTSTPVTLGDSPTNGGTVPFRNLRINGEAVAQDVPLFRAAGQAVLDRGNRKTEITLAATRVFTTFQLAEDFLLLHDLALQGNADLIITEADGGTLRYLRSATVRSQSTAKGMTVETSYHITGGLITTS